MIVTGNDDVFLIAMEPHEARALYQELMNMQVNGTKIVQKIFDGLRYKQYPETE